MNTNGTQFRLETGLNADHFTEVSFTAYEDITFTGANNDQVHAWFHRPQGYSSTSSSVSRAEEKKKCPLLLFIHGGPQGAWNNQWHSRWNLQVFANQGYAVLAINIHGSTGYGQPFCDSINNDWGGKPFTDLMLGVDHVLQKYEWLDEKRMAALGGSYGGYMVNWINGHTDRFKALVCHAGIFNLTSLYYATEELFFPEWEFNGPAYDQEEAYEKWSPHKYVKNWKTPTLVIQGGKDYRVVETEALSTFTALQRRGIISELLHFPEENHFVTNPNNSLAWHSHIFNWLAHFLNEDTTQDKE